MSLADAAATSCSGGALGLAVMLQRLPSQCSASGRKASLTFQLSPTAQTSVGETAATALRKLCFTGCGLGTKCQEQRARRLLGADAHDVAINARPATSANSRRPT